MAKQLPPKTPAPLPDSATGTNPLATTEQELGVSSRKSHDLIYQSVMRGGGEPFLAPLGNGLSSLTEKIVKLFKLKGFFGFETFERPRRAKRRNKFTRYGASRHMGRYDPRAASADRTKPPKGR